MSPDHPPGGNGSDSSPRVYWLVVCHSVITAVNVVSLLGTTHHLVARSFPETMRITLSCELSEGTGVHDFRFVLGAGAKIALPLLRVTLRPTEPLHVDQTFQFPATGPQELWVAAELDGRELLRIPIWVVGGPASASEALPDQRLN